MALTLHSILCSSNIILIKPLIYSVLVKIIFNLVKFFRFLLLCICVFLYFYGVLNLYFDGPLPSVLLTTFAQNVGLRIPYFGSQHCLCSILLSLLYTELVTELMATASVALSLDRWFRFPRTRAQFPCCNRCHNNNNNKLHI